MRAQPLLPLPRPLPVRLRSVRRPFRPAEAPGPYSLPRPVLDLLTVALAGYRNRDAALALAVFIARYWSSPGRLMLAFPIDRRALTDHAGLGLTEARIRGAVRVLEEIGFLDRDIPPPGSRYKATAAGLHRRPILFAFGGEFSPLFAAANQRAARARQARSSRQGHQPPSLSPRPSTPLPAVQLSSPKVKAPPGAVVVMGEVGKGSPGGRMAPSAEPDPRLEAALARLRSAISGQGGQP